MKLSCTAYRTKLVDEPVVELLLTNKYHKSDLKFIRSDFQSDTESDGITCFSSGAKRLYCVKRNSSKYYNSPNFSISINKNRLDVYNNTSYVFIDEVSDCLYIVDGMDLLRYIIDHIDKICESDKKSNSFYMIIPKNDISLMTPDKDHIIKYNKTIANILANSRDESMYMNLI